MLLSPVLWELFAQIPNQKQRLTDSLKNNYSVGESVLCESSTLGQRMKDICDNIMFLYFATEKKCYKKDFFRFGFF